MTIANAVNKSGPYFYNGAATSFAYGFKIDDAAYIRVVETVLASGVETDLVLNSDYTVTGVGDDTGNVVISPARAAGRSVTLVRNVPFTQLTVLENQGAYFAEVVEAALDRAVARDQQLQEQISRAVVVPVSSDGTDVEELIAGVVALLDNVDAVVTVAGISAAVEVVAANVTPINVVATNVTSVQTVAANIAAVTTVAVISAAVSTVAGVAANVTTVAGIAAAVSTVAGVSAAVSTVAANIASVNTAATNIAAIIAAPAAATAAAGSAAAAAASAASVNAADIVHYTAETNSEARQAQARKNIGMEYGYPMLHVVDEKTANTNGGASVVGWQVRALNTARVNRISGASVASNKITLPAGTYLCAARTVTYGVAKARSRLFDETAGGNLILGQSASIEFGSASSSIPEINGEFTLAVTSTIRLETYCDEVRASGLGIAGGSGNAEVYSEIQIWKAK